MILPRAWDEGITWYSDVIEAPEDQPLELAVVRDQHLRALNGTADNAYIERLIATTTRLGQRVTRRAWMPQTRALVLSRFPSGRIEVPWPPLISVSSIVYIDVDGNDQTLDAADYQVSAPQGDTARRGWIAPAPNGTWPETQTDAFDTVTVTFECGYPLVDGEVGVPEDLLQAQLLVIGELWEQRSESAVNFDTSRNAAFVMARSLWLEYRVH